MYHLAIFVVVTSIVMGAAGVVYLINAIKHSEDRRKHVAMTTVFFFGCLSTALLATYMFSSKRGGRRSTPVRMSASQEVRMDPAVMLAASAGAGSTMA
jgi:hypothetical protein